MTGAQRRPLKRVPSGRLPSGQTRGRGVVGLTVLAVIIGLFAGSTGPVEAASPFSFSRVAGADRYETAEQIAATSFPSTVSSVIVASGESPVDGLAASYLAGRLDGPVLLTSPGTLPDSTARAIRSLQPTKVIVAGGADAVNPSVIDSLVSLGVGAVERRGGATRYETAAAMADGTGVAGIVDGLPTAIAVNGGGFADGLAAGPLAYALRVPLLLTTATDVPSSTADALRAHDVRQVLLVGGANVLGPAVESALTGMGLVVKRLAGADRTQTAKAVAEFALGHGFRDDRINLATGSIFADAMSSTPAAGRDRVPLLLTVNTTTLGSGATEYLIEHCETLVSGTAFGGPIAISDTMLDVAAALPCAGASPTTTTTASPTTTTTASPTTTTTAPPATPSIIATAAAAGDLHSLAVKPDGTVWAWGYNYYGQVGDGTTTNRSTPVQVAGLSGVSAVAGGFDHSIALKTDGTVWAWGLNSSGQLGDGTTTNRTTPVQVTGLSGVTAIVSGGHHSMALKLDGSVWTWGYNISGQLGDGTSANRSSPVQVTGLSGVTAIAGGDFHSIALKIDGTVWTWGYNYYGQLGDGTTTNRYTPVQVTGLTGVNAIAGGDLHSIALKLDGTVWTWGFNGSGQLGDGTSTSRSTPVPV